MSSSLNPATLSPSTSIETPLYSLGQTSSDGVVLEPTQFEQALQLGRNSVQLALSSVDCNTLSRLLLTYFEYTEYVLRLGILLNQNIHCARVVYAPMHEFLDNLSLELKSDAHPLSLSQCILAFNVFHEFSHSENPFLSPDIESLDDLRNSILQLKWDLDHYSKKLRSKLCNVCTFTPLSMGKKGRARLGQIDAAARGVYLLLNDMHTIENLMVRLHAAVEDDKRLLDLGLERGVEQHVIQEILKVFQRSSLYFNRLLVEFEEHLQLCFFAIHQARSHLLQKIMKQRN